MYSSRRAFLSLTCALYATLLFAACGDDGVSAELPAPSIEVSLAELMIDAGAGGGASDTVVVSYEDLDARPVLALGGDADRFEVTPVEETGTPAGGATSYRVVFNAPAEAGEGDTSTTTLVFRGASVAAGEDVEAEVSVTGRVVEEDIADPPGRPS